MKHHSLTRLLAFAAASTLFAACGAHAASPVPALSASSGKSAGTAQSDVQMSPETGGVQRSCQTIRAGDEVRCFSMMRIDLPIVRTPDASASQVQGYGPKALQAAYVLPSATQGAGQTVGIVDAYDDPYAGRDMAVYRRHFHLPPCTTDNGCFRKVGQTGGAVPSPDAGWSQEISLDLDMVSAICPNCHILLVEANTPSFRNLGLAVDEAVALGANVVSNSYGGPEQMKYNADYDHPGTIITASSGDSGSGAQQPCSFATVVCVGGTHLQLAPSSGRGWVESAWSYGGSGCSAIVGKPSWQTDVKCPNRSESDVSAVADPSPGLAVYDSYEYSGYVGWLDFGGTSASSPIIASVYALAGSETSLNYAQGLWQNLGGADLNDIVRGNNGVCSFAYQYICRARPGYDGPTGVGTPNTLGAFQ